MEILYLFSQIFVGFLPFKKEKIIFVAQSARCPEQGLRYPQGCIEIAQPPETVTYLRSQAKSEVELPESQQVGLVYALSGVPDGTSTVEYYRLNFTEVTTLPFFCRFLIH